jgi:hypothetical protein
MVGATGLVKAEVTELIGADLIEGMKLVLAHQRGKIELEQVWPKPVDVKAVSRTQGHART